MDHQPICTTRGRKPAKRAQASGSLLPLTLLVVTAVANAGSAGEASSPPRMAYQDLPEAILLPLKHEGKLAAGGGWVLSYRNGLTGTDQPEREAQSRYVTHSDRANTPTTSLISWEITRTPNNLCPEAALRRQWATLDPCHERRIRVQLVFQEWASGTTTRT